MEIAETTSRQWSAYPRVYVATEFNFVANPRLRHGRRKLGLIVNL